MTFKNSCPWLVQWSNSTLEQCVQKSRGFLAANKQNNESVTYARPYKFIPHFTLYRKWHWHYERERRFPRTKLALHGCTIGTLQATATKDNAKNRLEKNHCYIHQQQQMKAINHTLNRDLYDCQHSLCRLSQRTLPSSESNESPLLIHKKICDLVELSVTREVPSHLMGTQLFATSASSSHFQ